MGTGDGRRCAFHVRHFRVAIPSATPTPEDGPRASPKTRSLNNLSDSLSTKHSLHEPGGRPALAEHPQPHASRIARDVVIACNLVLPPSGFDPFRPGQERQRAA